MTVVAPKAPGSTSTFAHAQKAERRRGARLVRRILTGDHRERDAKMLTVRSDAASGGSGRWGRGSAANARAIFALVKDRLEVVRTGSVAFVLLHSPPISGIGHGCTKVRIDQRVSKGNIWMSRIFHGWWKGREKAIGDSHIANGTMNVCIRIRKVPVKKRIQTERRRRNAGRISRQRRRGIIRHH